jgi:hypothetical protein
VCVASLRLPPCSLKSCESVIQHMGAGRDCLLDRLPEKETVPPFLTGASLCGVLFMLVQMSSVLVPSQKRSKRVRASHELAAQENSSSAGLTFTFHRGCAFSERVQVYLHLRKMPHSSMFYNDEQQGCVLMRSLLAELLCVPAAVRLG